MVKGVYFFLRPFRSPQDAGYQHRSVSLAEGLRSLNVPFFSNINYWQIEPGSQTTLFTEGPGVQPDDCDVVIAEHIYYDAERRLPAPFKKEPRKYRTVFVDASDGWRTPAMPAYTAGVDLVLRCHYNSRFTYGKNVRPWAFGLSNRMVGALKKALPPGSREKSLACNYRVLHPVRKAAEQRFIPLVDGFFHVDRTIDSESVMAPADRLMWEQSGRRHYPEYYARLSKSVACSAFGGYFVPSISSSVDSLPQRVAHKAVSAFGVQTRTVAQFDSWRFWESLAAGCVTFHLDFERYGCSFPVMPENGRHYIGVDLNCPAKMADAVIDGGLDLRAIAAAGREWAIEQYSPVAVARRFLEHVEVA